MANDSMLVAAQDAARIMLQDERCCSVWWMPHESELRLVKVVSQYESQHGVIFKEQNLPADPPSVPWPMRMLEVDLRRWRQGVPLEGFDVQKLIQVGWGAQQQFSKNRKQRRAERSQRGKLRALEGGKETPEDTPAQRFGEDMKAHIAHYLKAHSGLDSMNVTKVLLQLASGFAMDNGADRHQYVAAASHLFEEEAEARRLKGV